MEVIKFENKVLKNICDNFEYPSFNNADKISWSTFKSRLYWIVYYNTYSTTVTKNQNETSTETINCTSNNFSTPIDKVIYHDPIRQYQNY